MTWHVSSIYRFVAVGDFVDHTFKLFSASDGRLHQSILAHSDMVTCLAGSDDGCERFLFQRLVCGIVAWFSSVHRTTAFSC